MFIIDSIIRLYEVVILIRVVMSWVSVDERNRLFHFVYQITEPVLEPLRRILPGSRLGIDFSPMIVLLALELIRRIL